MRTLLKPIILLFALALVAAACTSSTSDPTTTPPPTTVAAATTTVATTTTTAAPTTTTTSTTTTTIAPGIEATINGLAAEEGTADRRVIGVKIDNHPAARPQTALNSADVVYEILVEGGLTRFIALFHQSDAEKVGPVRSLRPTDVEIMTPLGGPLQISGAAEWVYRYAAKFDMKLLRDDGTTTQRDSARSAPHNLYGNTTQMRDRSDQKGYPDDPAPALFSFGLEPTATTETATHVELHFSDHPASTWDWDGERYVHSYGGDPHETIETDGSAVPVVADYLVVIFGEKYTARPPTPGEGKAVPATHTIGSGRALIFRDGGLIEAQWKRDTIDDLISLKTNNGDEIVLPPGRIWVEIFPSKRTIVWE